MSEHYDPMLIEVMPDGRWVIGRKLASRCPWCDADAVEVRAANGRAIVWRPPTDCCEKARERNRRLTYGTPEARARPEVAYGDDGRVSK